MEASKFYNSNPSRVEFNLQRILLTILMIHRHLIVPLLMERRLVGFLPLTVDFWLSIVE